MYYLGYFKEKYLNVQAKKKQ